MGRLGTRTQLAWGLLGAAFAALFAIWMLFFPEAVPTLFAWNVQPRFAQVVIGAGYVFRTAFFLNVAFEKDWLRLRWIVWGNLVFTGVLLFATYWHAPEFLWDPFTSPVAHIWIVLYIFEPVVMIYLLPPGILRAQAPATGGPIVQPFRWFLVLVTGLLLMFGLLLLLNPEFAATRWPWELNGLDARIVAAWALGWAVWCGTMALATDWDEIRTAAASVRAPRHRADRRRRRLPRRVPSRARIRGCVHRRDRGPDDPDDGFPLGPGAAPASP